MAPSRVTSSEIGSGFKRPSLAGFKSEAELTLCRDVAVLRLRFSVWEVVVSARSEGFSTNGLGSAAESSRLGSRISSCGRARKGSATRPPRIQVGRRSADKSFVSRHFRNIVLGNPKGACRSMPRTSPYVSRPQPLQRKADSDSDRNLFESERFYGKGRRLRARMGSSKR